MAANDGGPAFPVASTEHLDYASICGMSLRAWFAGTIAAGYRAGKVFHAGAYPSESKMWSSQEVARNAVRDADALIAELSKEQP